MKVFTRFFVLCIFACLMFQACFTTSETITGNGNLIREEFTISDYNEILLNIPAEVFYNNDTIASPYLQIYGDENILSHINVDVKNGKLIIKSKNDVNLKATSLKIFTNSGNLNAFDIAGSGKVYLKGEINAGEIRLNISGSGYISADSLYCERIKLNIFGSGSTQLTGVSNYTEFNISGSGNIDALKFSSLKANAKVSGSGRIKLWVGQELEASISGSGDIQYKGYPETVNTQVAGSGHIFKTE